MTKQIESAGAAETTTTKKKLTADEVLRDAHILEMHREHGTEKSAAADSLLRDAEEYARRFLGTKSPAVALSLVIEFIRFQRFDFAETLKYRKHERVPWDESYRLGRVFAPRRTSPARATGEDTHGGRK